MKIAETVCAMAMAAGVSLALAFTRPLPQHEDFAEPIILHGSNAEYTERGTFVVTALGCDGAAMPSDAPCARRFAATLAAEIDRVAGCAGEAYFIDAMRTGRRADGQPVDADVPVDLLRELPREDLLAVYLYLKGAPAQAAENGSGISACA